MLSSGGLSVRRWDLTNLKAQYRNCLEPTGLSDNMNQRVPVRRVLYTQSRAEQSFSANWYLFTCVSPTTTNSEALIPSPQHISRFYRMCVVFLSQLLTILCLASCTSCMSEYEGSVCLVTSKHGDSRTTQQVVSHVTFECLGLRLGLGCLFPTHYLEIPHHC